MSQQGKFNGFKFELKWFLRLQNYQSSADQVKLKLNLVDLQAIEREIAQVRKIGNRIADYPKEKDLTPIEIDVSEIYHRRKEVLDAVEQMIEKAKSDGYISLGNWLKVGDYDRLVLEQNVLSPPKTYQGIPVQDFSTYQAFLEGYPQDLPLIYFRNEGSASITELNDAEALGIWHIGRPPVSI